MYTENDLKNILNRSQDIVARKYEGDDHTKTVYQTFLNLIEIDQIDLNIGHTEEAILYNFLVMSIKDVKRDNNGKMNYDQLLKTFLSYVSPLKQSIDLKNEPNTRVVSSSDFGKPFLRPDKDMPNDPSCNMYDLTDPSF